MHFDISNESSNIPETSFHLYVYYYAANRQLINRGTNLIVSLVINLFADKFHLLNQLY